MNRQELISEILNSNLSADDLRALNGAVIGELKAVRAREARAVKYALNIGSKVQWEGYRSNGRGRRRTYLTLTGEVTDIKQKYAHCREDGAPAHSPGWRIPLAGLTILKA